MRMHANRSMLVALHKTQLRTGQESQPKPSPESSQKGGRDMLELKDFSEQETPTAQTARPTVKVETHKATKLL